MKRITFHLPKTALAKGAAKMKPFYKGIMAGLETRGIEVRCVVHDRSKAHQIVDGVDGFHVIDHGRIQHDRALNTGIAYIYPFWNVDPLGIRAFSSIASTPFDPARVPQGLADEFWNRLRWRLVKQRQSRYPQPEDPTQGLPQDAISVFLQAEHDRDPGEVLYLDRTVMVETVLEASEGRPVIVKAHPNDLAGETYLWLADLLRRWDNLTVSEGNIHDILAVSSHVVTHTSAVGLEAMLHNKPVVLCGHADFLHVCETAKTTGELERALKHVPTEHRYKKYLYWYFRMNCLAAGDRDLTEKFLERIAEHGYDL